MPDRGATAQDAWIVLLLGCASGVGKSMVSHRLARRLDVGLTEVDDFQTMLTAARTPEQLPLLHFWRTSFDEYSSRTDERRVEHHVRVCRAVFDPPMRAVIADHLETRSRTPARWRAMFVSEPDEAQVVATMPPATAGPSPSGRGRAGSSTRSCGTSAPVTASRSSTPARGDTLLERALAAVG